MESSTKKAESGPGEPGQPADEATISKIEGLLKTKDDTSRFVGLALLKSVLDNSPELRQDSEIMSRLWVSISPRFLDRLIRSGSNPGTSQDGKEMLSLAVQVIHTFAVLLPDEHKSESSLSGRIPSLVSSILHSSNETTSLILQTLITLCSFPEGAVVFYGLQDISPLTEVATTHNEALQVLTFAWLNAMRILGEKSSLSTKMDETISSLAIIFKRTDAVTFLDFLSYLLRNVDLEVLPSQPKWWDVVIGFVKTLVTSRPTPEARSAYTNLVATLLHVYSQETCLALFAASSTDDRPVAYLLINLLLIDIRSTCPALLGNLNTPAYEGTASRITSAFDVVSAFIGFLVRSLDGDDTPLPLTPDLLLKLRKSISETVSVTMEYLRDRWDASVAGAMGLHPDARIGKAETSMGSRLTLAWDSAKDSASDDPLILAAVRTVAIWLREDDNDMLRQEAAGLIDMFMQLYGSSATGKLDFRSPILVALEGIMATETGPEAFLINEGWKTLVDDMLMILHITTREDDISSALRGLETVRVLLAIVEGESSGTREAWMDIITAVAAWSPPDAEQSGAVQDFQAAVLELSSSLLASAGPGMRGRYVHSTTAILGVAQHLKQHTGRGNPVRNSLDDVIATLDGLR